MEDPNIFAGAYVDRTGERRKDPDWLAEASASADSVFMPVWRHRCLVQDDGGTTTLCLVTRSETGLDDESELIFLGLYQDRPVFAYAVPGDEPPFGSRGRFEELRALGTLLAPDQANLAAHARALVIWHESTLYCGACGSKSVPIAGGNARVCAHPDCGRTLFPRVDPAIIVLVSHGDRCLLGRQPTWPTGLYSTIAGFTEPGESIEDAVRREVFEETNIRVGRVTYHSSQPWPFPASLMLGFLAEATSTDIRLNDAELEDARWFTRQDLRSAFPHLPHRVSIAKRLIDHWLGLPDAP